MPLWVFEWLEATSFGQFIRHSTWLFPAIEAVHLLGLCALGGTLLVVDLRLLGAGLRDTPVSDVARGAQRWLVASVVLMFSTGIPLFLSEAVKCYHNPSFWVKVSTLPFALVFTFAVRQPLAIRGMLSGGWWPRLVAVTSIGLWLTVASAGRWIGFSS